MSLTLPRRAFLTGLLAVAAPALVPASSLMRLRGVVLMEPLEVDFISYDQHDPIFGSVPPYVTIEDGRALIRCEAPATLTIKALVVRRGNREIMRHLNGAMPVTAGATVQLGFQFPRALQRLMGRELGGKYV